MAFRAPNIISNMWLGEWITLRFTQQLIDLNDALGEEIQCEEIYCSRHFEDSCFKGSRLVKNSVPSRFLHPSVCEALVSIFNSSHYNLLSNIKADCFFSIFQDSVYPWKGIKRYS